MKKSLKIKLNRKVLSILSAVKRNLVTVGGLRRVFSVRILETNLLVDYNIRSSRADRDYSIILQLSKDKRCILDVGANHGLISLLIAKNNHDAQIFALEASEVAVNVINRNVSLNGLSDRIKAINSLVADSSGKTMSFYGEGSSGGASITKGRLGHTIEIEKSTLSLDDYVRNKNLRPDFIKMDIEGAESIAIRGMSHVLENIRPDIFLELHGLGELSLLQNAQSIKEMTDAYRYVMVYLRTGNVIDDVAVLADRGRCHLFLTPSEKFSSVYINSLSLDGL